jgi:hypothetical protein
MGGAFANAKLCLTYCWKKNESQCSLFKLLYRALCYPSARSIFLRLTGINQQHRQQQQQVPNFRKRASAPGISAAKAYA